MSVIKISVVVILACFLLSGHAQRISADTLTLDEFVGVWYDIAGASALLDPKEVFTCISFNVSKLDDGDQHFKSVYTYKRNGIWEISGGNGTITGSKFSFSFSNHQDNKYTYSFQKFNNAKDLVSTTEGNNYGLSSRSFTYSAEAKAAFEKLAADAGVTPVYFDHSNCA